MFVGEVARYWRQVGIGLRTSVFPLAAQAVLLQNLLVLQNMDIHLDLLVLPDKKHSEDSLHTFSLLR